MEKPAQIIEETTSQRAYISTNQFDVDCPPENENRRNAQVHPGVASQANGASFMFPSSNCVTPMPHYIPRIGFVDWLIGAFSVVQALLDPGGELEKRGKVFVSSIHETIDLEDYLPTSYDDMRDWRVSETSVTRDARV